MKSSSLLVAVFVLNITVFSQSSKIDSLRNSLRYQNELSQRIETIAELGKLFKEYSTDSILLYGKMALREARVHEDIFNEARAIHTLSSGFYHAGKFDSSIHYGKAGLELIKEKGHDELESSLLRSIGGSYRNAGLSLIHI